MILESSSNPPVKKYQLPIVCLWRKGKKTSPALNYDEHDGNVLVMEQTRPNATSDQTLLCSVSSCSDHTLHSKIIQYVAFGHSTTLCYNLFVAFGRPTTICYN